MERIRRRERIILGEQKKPKPQFLRKVPLKYIAVTAGMFALGFFLVGGLFWGFFFGALGLAYPIYARREDKKKQLQWLELQLEEALYRGVNVLRGGGGLYQLIEYLASEKTPEPLRGHFEGALYRMRDLGVAPIDSLKTMMEELPQIKSLGLLHSALEEGQKNGADLAQVTELFAEDLRNRRMMRQEIDAKTTQGKMTANFLFGMGVVVPGITKLINNISITGPDTAITIQIITAFCYCMMLVGYLIIRKLVGG